ncbi:MAG: hypothetical protein ACKO7D_03050 [Bacteroidota bacterium]
MNKQTATILQFLGELAIPLLGYFLWDWSLLFILLFYLIENLFYSFFRIETIREINKLVLKKDQPRNAKIVIHSLLLWLFECVLVHVFILVIQPNQSIFNEWIHFFMYEDLGVPQGIVLLPLLYFASRMKMKQDVLLFVRNMKSTDELNQLTVNFNATWIAIGIWGILIGVNYFIQIQELLNLSFVLVILIVRSLKRN